MDRIERALMGFVVALSQLLDPVVAGLQRLHLYIRTQLSFARVPVDWQGTVILAGWVVVLFMVFRVLTGWLQMVMLVLTALVVVKVYGYLPT